MQHLLDEVEIDTNAPAAFFSGHLLGKVKWRDTIKPLDSCFHDLNQVASWAGDFRDVYPNWSYEYRVVESIGGIPVEIWVKRQRGGR